MKKLKMSPTTVATYGVLSLAAGGVFMMPQTLPRMASAVPQTTTGGVMRLGGKLFDFLPSHPDMETTPSDGNGVYAGLVDQTLGADGNPGYDGSGRKVLSTARDGSGNPIAAFMANRGGGISDFDIVNGQVVVNEEFEALVVVLGVDVSDVPVTFRAQADNQIFMPFGDYNATNGGNINEDLATGTSGSGDTTFPRVYLLPQVFDPGTAVALSGKSWKQSNGTWTTRLTADSNVASQQVIVLRDGDAVPAIDPYGDQQSLAEYIADYVDENSNTIQLEPYQVIYLYELYTTNLSDDTADFQDMVVLLNLARPEAPVTDDGQVLGCGPGGDTEATLSDTISSGGISGPDSFNQWFTDVLGTNQSARTSIDLYEQGDGTFLFDDETDLKYAARGGYYPADGMLLDASGSGHNDYFTTKFEATFTYDDLGDQFFEVTSSGDVWVFIDDQLVIDLGGIHNEATQRVDLSRLCLNDGEQHKLTVFRAQRAGGQSRFRVWTNLIFGPVTDYAVTGQFD